VSSTAISSDGLEYVVSLTGATNAQKLTVTLTSITDSAGGFTGTLPGTMGVLIGDVDGKATPARHPDATNYRYDIDHNGRIDGNDVSTAQAQTRTLAYLSS
jgi:hypothetical protein